MQISGMLARVLSLAVLASGSAAAYGADAGQDTTKWGKYIMAEMPAPTKVDQAARAAEAATLGDRIKDMTRGIRELDGKVAKGACYTDVARITKANPGTVWVNEHSHPFAETLGFFGSDPEHPDELNAVIDR